MYSIPPGGFRHPYPALAMNASMSRWVSAGTRDPPWASWSWAQVFGCFPEDNAGLGPTAALAVGAPGDIPLRTGTDQPQEVAVASSAKNTPGRVQMVPTGDSVGEKQRPMGSGHRLGWVRVTVLQAAAGYSIKPDPNWVEAGGLLTQEVLRRVWGGSRGLLVPVGS